MCFCPRGENGNVGPGWDSEDHTERVEQGRRLMVPRAMADSLRGRKQAVSLPPGASIPVYFRRRRPRRLLRQLGWWVVWEGARLETVGVSFAKVAAKAGDLGARWTLVV